jgi:hypothetical protein
MFKLRASVKLQVYDSVGINKEKKASVYGHRDIGDMNQIRSKAQVSRSEHKSDYNTASISNTASILEFPSQISRSRVQDAALITSKQEACTGHASYLNIILAYACACMHDMLYARNHGDIGDIRPDQAKQGRVQTDAIHHDTNKQSIEEITRTCYHLYGMHVYSSCPQQLGLSYSQGTK